MMNDSEDMLTAGTLIDGARMYAAAADAINSKLPNSMHVLSHILGISIELALKAYLRHAGYEERRLKTIGHDLGLLLDHAIRHGLYETGSRKYVLAVVGHYYRERLFVYPRKGTHEVITPGRLRQMTDELIQEIFIKIKGEDTFKNLKDAPGLCIQSEYPEDFHPSAWAEVFPSFLPHM